MSENLFPFNGWPLFEKEKGDGQIIPLIVPCIEFFDMLIYVTIFVTKELFMATKRERKILNISLPSELYKKVEQLSKEQAKAKSEFVREVLRQYVASDRRWKQIRKWGQESSKRLGIKDQGDVEGIIEQYRKEQSL